MIGHNNPPPCEAMALHIEDLFSLVSDTLAGATVETDEQDAALDALLDDLRKARKDADAQRVIEKKPHDDAAAEVQAAWKPLLARCDMGVAEIKRLLTPYRDAKQLALEAAAALAREEAAARQKAAQDALKASDDLQSKFDAEAELKLAGKLVATANKIDRAPTGLRTHWACKVTNYNSLFRWVKDTDPQAIRDFLDAYAAAAVSRGTRSLSGVEINPVRQAA